MDAAGGSGGAGNSKRDEKCDIRNHLLDMFGEVLGADVIESLTGSCSNTQQAVELAMNLLDEMEKSDDSPEEVSVYIPAILVPSYANTSKNNPTINPPRGRNNKNNIVTQNDQLRKIVQSHTNGYCIMIVMRGVPGSGKTYLAKQIVNMTVGGTDLNYKCHIFSTDNYFSRFGNYVYDPSRLDKAHEWNKKSVRDSLEAGLSPVIVDNTNIELWEMEPYVAYAIRNGYIIEVVEPNTPWCKNPRQLESKNVHGVPAHKIRKMLDKYQHTFSVDRLLRSYRIQYRADKTPPILRKTPPLPLMAIPMSQGRIIPENEPSTSQQLIPTAIPMPQGGVIPENETSTSHQLTLTAIPMSQDRMIPENEPSTAQQHTLTTIPLPQGQMIPENEPSTSQQLTLMGSEFGVIPIKHIETEPSSESHTVRCPALQGTHHDDSTAGTSCQKQTSLEDVSSLLGELKCQTSEQQTEDASTTDVETDKDGKGRQSVDECKKKSEAQVEEFEKIFKEWENGGDWQSIESTTDNIRKAAKINIPKSISYEPKQQRENTRSRDSSKTRSLQSIPGTLLYNSTDCQVISSAISASDQDTTHEKEQLKTTNDVATSTKGIDNYDINNTNEIVVPTSPRDINIEYIQPSETIIPYKRTLDKGSMTNDYELIIKGSPYRCKHEDKHFLALKKMFKHIAEADLKDLFDKCGGDVNWTTELLLETENITEKTEQHDSDPEDEHNSSGEMCDCVAAYNIIPTPSNPNVELPSELPQGVPLEIRKVKKDKTPSESSVHLKRHIEKSVTISDNHYSLHNLKIRNWRRGEIPSNNFQDPNAPSTSKAQFTPNNDVNPAVNSIDQPVSSDEDSSDQDDFEETYNVKLGVEFIRQMDHLLCNNRNYDYPAYILPVVCMPRSLLNQINALWMESVWNQIEVQSNYSDLLLKEDEDLARRLEEEELVLARQEGGEATEPEPDFREIMDQDLAQSLYERDVSEWRNTEPQDIAAKMSRDKLYNLFPDVSQDVLSEVLLAHDNNFNSTVEVLLTSMGKGDVLREKNGLYKFVEAQERARKQKCIDEDQQALDRDEWPILSGSEQIDLSTVTLYRDKAKRQLDLREEYLIKAQRSIQEGNVSIAASYRKKADFRLRLFEKNNSLAAYCLLRLQSMDNSKNMLDLHYMYVAEAIQALDIFIDHHIQDLSSRHPRARRDLYFITGRGLRSKCGPKILPAAKKRLSKRGLETHSDTAENSELPRQQNPGLLAVTINVQSKLSHQVKL